MTTSTKTTFTQTTTAGGWFPYTPAAESQAIEFSDARAVTLWLRLRHRYWLTECQPLTQADITNQRRKMEGINPADAMSDDEVHALLVPNFGFVSNGELWAMPSLQGHRDDLMTTAQRRKESAVKAGQASAQKRTVGVATAGHDF